MPPVQPSRLGGMFGSSGVTAIPPHTIDVAGAINAMAGGASSLIQNAYTRKMGMLNYQLRLKQLDEEHQVRMQQLQSMNDFHTAMIGDRTARTAIMGGNAEKKSAQATKLNRGAFETIKQFDPTNDLVKPNEDGTPAEFDDANIDYTKPAASLLRQKATSDAEIARHADQLDTMTRAAQARDWVNKQKAKEAAAGPGKPLTAAQQRLRQNDFAQMIAEKADGDPVKALALVKGDKDLADRQAELGVIDSQIEARAKELGRKNMPTTSFTEGTSAGMPFTSTKTTGKIAPIATPPATQLPSATPGAAGLFKDPGGTVQSNPTGGGLPPVSHDPAVNPSPMVAPQQIAAPPGAPKPAAAPVPVGAPVTPGLNMTPIATPGATAAKAPAAPDEAALGHHDLWNLKVGQGMKPDDATAYVLNAKGPQKAPVAASVPAPSVQSAGPQMTLPAAPGSIMTPPSAVAPSPPPVGPPLGPPPGTY